MSAATMSFTPVVIARAGAEVAGDQAVSSLKGDSETSEPASAPAESAPNPTVKSEPEEGPEPAVKSEPESTVTSASAPASGPASASGEDTPIAPSKDQKDNGRGQFSLTPVCQNCQTSTTPLWRRDEAGQVLCNACGLFLKLHGRARPISLKTNVIKSRNRIKNHGHGPGNPAVAHGVQYNVVAASHMPPHVHPQHPHGPPPHGHVPAHPGHHGHPPPGMHMPMHVTHIGHPAHGPLPHMWQQPHPHHQGPQPLHPMAAMKDHQPQQQQQQQQQPPQQQQPQQQPQQHPVQGHYLPPPQYASPQYPQPTREPQQSPSLPAFSSFQYDKNSAPSSAAATAPPTPSAAATASGAPPAAGTSASTPATANGSPTLKKITSPLLLSNNAPGPLSSSALDQLSVAASQSPYLTGMGEVSASSASAPASATTDLRTRLSELELVNDLFRTRVSEVEAAEQAARRSEASIRESEMLLRSALHRLETRNRVLEKRCKKQQEKLAQFGAKLDDEDDDDDVLEDSDVVLPPLRDPPAGTDASAMTSTTILPTSPVRRRRSSVGGHESAKREFDGLRKKVRVSDLI